jgi:hypothetical protein
MDSAESVKAEIAHLQGRLARLQKALLLLQGSEAPSPVTLGDHIVAALKDAGRPLRYDEIRERLPRHKPGTMRSVQNECSKLVAKGRIERVRSGVFRVP